MSIDNRNEQEQSKSMLIFKGIIGVIVVMLVIALGVSSGVYFARKSGAAKTDSADVASNSTEVDLQEDEPVVANVTLEENGTDELIDGLSEDNIMPADEDIISVNNSKYADVEIGDTITFGYFEQDNDTTNGKENLDWIVLDKQEDKILVITRYAIDVRPFNAKSWDNSEIRQWLNGDFLNETFDSEERACIIETDVHTENNEDYGTYGGSDTIDRVFLLSISEAKKYFDSDEARRAPISVYAYENYGFCLPEFKVDGRDTAWWLLRSPGHEEGYIAMIENSGAIYSHGDLMVAGMYNIRPALWINIK